MQRLMFRRLKTSKDKEEANNDYRKKTMGKAAKKKNKDNKSLIEEMPTSNSPDFKPTGLDEWAKRQ